MAGPIRANGGEPSTPRLEAVVAWQRGHEDLCLERHTNILKRLDELQDQYEGIIKHLQGINRTGWAIVATVFFSMMGLLAWFFLQVWPVQTRLEALAVRGATVPVQVTVPVAAPALTPADREHYDAALTQLQQRITELQAAAHENQRLLTPPAPPRAHRRSGRSEVPF